MRPAARACALFVAALAVGAAGSDAAAAPSIEQPIVVLRGLDKVTARVTELSAPIGDEIQFGKLTITPRTCLVTPPTEPPESAAFLEIRERGADASAQHLFSGWMFASSPAVSALEHAIYDIWLLRCDPKPEPQVGPQDPSEEEGSPGRVLNLELLQ